MKAVRSWLVLGSISLLAISAALPAGCSGGDSAYGPGSSPGRTRDQQTQSAAFEAATQNGDGTQGGSPAGQAESTNASTGLTAAPKPRAGSAAATNGAVTSGASADSSPVTTVAGAAATTMESAEAATNDDTSGVEAQSAVEPEPDSRGSFDFGGLGGGRDPEPLDFTADPANPTDCPDAIPELGDTCSTLDECHYGEEECLCDDILNGGTWDCGENQPGEPIVEPEPEPDANGAGGASAAGEPEPEPDPPEEEPVDTALWDSARAVIQSKCSGGTCHGANGFNVDDSEAQLEGKASEMVSRLNANTMPPDGSLSDADKQTIIDWANSL